MSKLVDHLTLGGMLAALMLLWTLPAHAVPISFLTFEPIPASQVLLTDSTADLVEGDDDFFTDIFNDDLLFGLESEIDRLEDNVLSFGYDFDQQEDSFDCADFGFCDVFEFVLYDSDAVDPADDPFLVTSAQIVLEEFVTSVEDMFTFTVGADLADTTIGLAFRLRDDDFEIGSFLQLTSLEINPLSSPAPVPLPGTLVLLLSGLAGLVGFRRVKQAPVQGR